MQKNISFRLDSQKKKSLDSLAESLGCDRTAVLNQAIDVFLGIYHWQTEQIKEGQKQAQSGEFVPEAEWRKAFNRERS